jgi:hypothetical protein
MTAPGSGSPQRPVRLRTPSAARRLAVLVIGSTVLGLGAAMLLLPGPGVLGVLLGLSILATEFAWARRLLRRAREAAGLGPPTSSSSSDSRSGSSC